MGRHYKTKKSAGLNFELFDFSQLKAECICLVNEICICQTNKYTPQAISPDEAKALIESGNAAKPTLHPPLKLNGTLP